MSGLAIALKQNSKMTTAPLFKKNIATPNEKSKTLPQLDLGKFDTRELSI